MHPINFEILEEIITNSKLYLSCICQMKLSLWKTLIIRNSNICCSNSEGQFCFKDITFSICTSQASDLAERGAHAANRIFQLKDL